MLGLPKKQKKIKNIEPINHPMMSLYTNWPSFVHFDPFC